MAIPRFPQGPFTQGSGPDQTEVLSPPYPRTPGATSGTPTLAQVLAAGNDPNGIGIIAATVAGGIGAELDVLPGAGGGGGGISALAGDGAAAQAGGLTIVAGGAGNAGAVDGAAVYVRPGNGVATPGRIGLYTDASFGTAGQVPQADGAGGSTWVTPAAATAPGVVGDIVAETLPSAAAAGASGKYADAAHRHAIAAAGAPVASAPGDAQATGAAGTFADSAHRHARETLASLPGAELDYAQITVPVTVTAVSEATANLIVSGGAVTYDGATAIIIEAFLPDWLINSGATGRLANLILYDGAASIGIWSIVQTETAGITFRTSVLLRRRLTPSAGAHTYSLRGSTTNAADTVLANVGAGGAGNNEPGYIRVTHV